MSLILAKSAIRDHWSDWTEELVPAPSFDVNAYQEKLNAVCGKSRGEPIMKLVWGGDATLTKYSEWDESGNPIKAQIIPRFAIPRRHAILDYEIYIPVRRWIICERRESEQHRPDDNSDNTFTDEWGRTCEAADKAHLGHRYLPYIYVGDHAKCPADCCKDRLCLGDYKPPDQAELDYLLECTYKLKSDFYCDPYSPLNEFQAAKLKKEYMEPVLKEKDKQDAEFDLESKEIYNTHFTGKIRFDMSPRKKGVIR